MKLIRNIYMWVKWICSLWSPLYACFLHGALFLGFHYHFIAVIFEIILPIMCKILMLLVQLKEIPYASVIHQVLWSKKRQNMFSQKVLFLCMCYIFLFCIQRIKAKETAKQVMICSHESTRQKLVTPSPISQKTYSLPQNGSKRRVL